MALFTDPQYSRTHRDELLLRCLLVESAHHSYAKEKMNDMLGKQRSDRQVPVSKSASPMRRALAVTSILYDHAGISGLEMELAFLIGEHETPDTLETYEAAGLRPMPVGLTEGAAYGGLRDALDYVQACEWGTVSIGWAPPSERPYISVMRPCDTRVYYSQADPHNPIRVEWDRSRLVDGTSMNVTDVWDVSNPDQPYFAVLEQLDPETQMTSAPYGIAERTTVTERVDELKSAVESGSLAGDGYTWRWTQGDREGKPFIPVAVYGHPARFFRNAQLAEGSLEACVMRTSALTAMLDGGFPIRMLQGFEIGTSADIRTEGVSLNPGDLLMLRNADETKPGSVHEFGPGAPIGEMWQEVRAFEADLLSALGYPVDYTKTGGEPLAHEVEARTRAIRRWYGICRAGDAQLLERIAAVVNNALDKNYPETGYASSYLEEVDKAIGASKPEPEPVIDPNTEPEPDEEPAEGEE